MFAEWRFMRQNRFLFVVLTALVLVPTIYAVIFLGSLWNAYTQTQNLPVAVVNHDQRVRYNGKNIQIGADLVANLKKSKQLDFQFVSDQQAQKGLKNGDYYTVITVPKDFSKNATTLLAAQPQKIQLRYQTSAGHSYIAMKMSESAVTKLNQKISAQVSELYAKTLFANIDKLADGYQTAGDNSQKLADGSTKIDASSQTLANGLQKLAASTLTFDNGAQTLTQGLAQYTTGVAQVADGSQQVTAGLTEINQQKGALQTGVGKLATGGQQLQTGVQQYTAGVGKVDAGAKQLNDGLKTLQAAANNPHQAQQLATLQKGLTAYQAGLADLKAATDDTQSQPILATMTKVSGSVQKLLEVVDEGQFTQAQQSALVTPINSLTAQLETLSKQLDTANQQKQELSQAVNQLQTNFGSPDEPQTIAGGVTTLMQQVAQSKTAINQLAGGSAQVAGGLDALQQQNATLNSGAQQLTTGLNQLQTQITPLTTGIATLTAGSQSVTNGANALTANNNSLLSGAQQLTDGANQLESGSQQLANGASQLPIALGQVASGNQQLADKLRQTSQQAQVTPGSAKDNQLAQPTQLKHDELDDVANNGTGMAPYMMSVGLYVAFVAFNMMMDMVTPRAPFKRVWSWWLSKLSLLAGFSIVATGLMYGATIVILGLNPVAPWATFGLLLLSAFVFGLLVTLLNVWLGKPGAFVALILLVLQLSTSAGTYPIELSGGFYRALHPWLPMTYVVDALRHTMMIGTAPGQSLWILLGFFTLFLLIWAAYYWTHAKKLTLKKRSAEA
ncbi:MAG TPA: YhgE/Pip domain-containing protein [Lactobacillaceae bacterium]|jgi:putative membrane protein